MATQHAGQAETPKILILGCIQVDGARRLTWPDSPIALLLCFSLF